MRGVEALDGGGWSTPRLGRLTPWNNPLPVYEAGWSQSQSGRVWETSLTPVFDPRTVQPVASRYTDYAVMFMLI
jgi:hypothetical protein